jgi:3-oxoacyl-[acyl-carrier-protein] synthase II
MKDVYIVDIAVRDCLGNNLAENYAKMAEATGPQRITRYNPDDYPQVLTTNGFQLAHPYAEKDNIGFKIAVDLADELASKYTFPKETAVILGSMALQSAIKDEFFAAFDNKQRRFSPTKLFMANHDLLSSMIASRLKLEGLSTSCNAACSSSMVNLYFAWLMIQAGETSAAIVGGVESPLWPNFQYYWQCTSAISTVNGGICKPFDKSRDGFLQGEGGTLFYICDEQTLREYNLTPMAVIKSITSGAKVTTITAHDKTGEHQGLMIDRALKNANLSLTDIAFFNAHATSTGIGDDIEFDAFAKKFDNIDIPIVSFKGYIGHTMNASGLLEAAYGIEAVKQKFVQPNFKLTDPLSPDPRLITEPTSLHSKYVMKASFGFGGRTSIAIFEAL